MVSVCTYVRKVGKVRELYDANIVARPPQINYKYMQINTRHPGHYGTPQNFDRKIVATSTRGARMWQMLRPMAIVEERS